MDRAAGEECEAALRVIFDPVRSWSSRFESDVRCWSGGMSLLAHRDPPSACKPYFRADHCKGGGSISREIHAVTAQRLGDTGLLRREGSVAGFAVCHIGAGTEAGSDSLYVKFATVRPGARQHFERLLDGCEGMAASVGARRIRAGANAGRRLACQSASNRDPYHGSVWGMSHSAQRGGMAIRR